MFDLGIKESKFQILPLPLITQAAVEDKHTPYVTMCLQGLNQIFSVECLGWNQTHVSAQETVFTMEMLLCTFIFSTGQSEGFISVRTKYFQKVKSNHAWHASFSSPRTFSDLIGSKFFIGCARPTWFDPGSVPAFAYLPRVPATQSAAACAAHQACCPPSSSALVIPSAWICAWLASLCPSARAGL